MLSILAQLVTEGPVNGPAVIDAADWWFNKALTWGLSFVFLACVLFILLWAAISLVNIAKEWIPRWFQSSIESHQQLAKAVGNLCDVVDCIHERTHSIHEGVKHGTKAVGTYVRKNKSKLDIPSDVMVHLNNAQDAIEGGTDHVHSLQRREEEEGNGGSSSKTSNIIKNTVMETI